MCISMKSIDHRRGNLCIRLSLLLSLILFFLFILPLVTCPLWGQAGQKKTLTVSDYNSFGVLTFDNISKDGKWASFRMTYQNGIDTLFIKNTASGRQYTLLSASNTHFFGNDHFVYQTQKGVVL